MPELRATISGRVGGVLKSTEVSGTTYDLYRALKAIWKFNGDQMAELATDGGRLELTEGSIQVLLCLMERDAIEMGASLTASNSS